MKKVNIDSPILEENLRNLYSTMGVEDGEESLVRMKNVSFESSNIFPDLGIYSDTCRNLISDFSVPYELAEKYTTLLEQSASLYLKLYPNHMKPLIYMEHMSRLKRIAKYSTYLRNELTNAHQNFFEFLDLANHFEEIDDDEPTVYEFFNSIGQSLDILEKLEKGVKNSIFGKSLGIGVPSKKRNWALYAWVTLHYNFWTLDLQRTMKRDKSGFGGRKRLLEYLDRLMAPLHPEMCSHDIDLGEAREHPVTNDAIDSVLKVIQKEAKLRAKIDTQNR